MLPYVKCFSIFLDAQISVAPIRPANTPGKRAVKAVV